MSVVFWLKVVMPTTKLAHLLSELDSEGGSPRPVYKVVEGMGGNKNALPVLRFYLRLPDSIAGRKGSALEAIVACGENGIPCLIETLNSSDKDMRFAALKELLGFDEDKCAPAIPKAVELLSRSA